MKEQVNGKFYDIPYSLTEISLGRFIEYQDRYGMDLDKQLDEIMNKEYSQDGFDEDDIQLHKTMAIDHLVQKEALAWFAFWTNTEPDKLTNHPAMGAYIDKYKLLRNIIYDDMQQAKAFPVDYEWNGELYSIQDWRVTPESPMSYGELITAKDITQQTYHLGKGRWGGLPYLCAIFFRKKGEAFTDDLVHQDHLQFMQQLPMNLALPVAFFLIGCVNFLRSTLAFSVEREEEIVNLN